LFPRKLSADWSSRIETIDLLRLRSQLSTNGYRRKPSFTTDCHPPLRRRLPTETADEDCRRRLPTKTADGDCRRRLPTENADGECRRRLPTKTLPTKTADETADEDCRRRLPTKTADGDCRRRLPTKTADEDCRRRLRTDISNDYPLTQTIAEDVVCSPESHYDHRLPPTFAGYPFRGFPPQTFAGDVCRRNHKFTEITNNLLRYSPDDILRRCLPQIITMELLYRRSPTGVLRRLGSRTSAGNVLRRCSLGDFNGEDLR